MYPLASNPIIGVHAAGFSIFHNRSALTLHVGMDSVKIFLDKIGDTLHTLLIGGEDRGDMNLAGDAFFDYHFIPVLILGLVSVLASPNWIMFFLLIGGIVGIAPHILGIDGHSGRLVCCLPPLAVFAGLGVNQFYLSLRSAFPGILSRLGLGLAMASYFGWAVLGIQDKVINQFFDGDRVEKTVSRQVVQFTPTAKVFIASYPLFVSSVTQTLLDQGYDFYLLKEHNPIYLKPGESPKDAVVLMHVYDEATRTKIEKQFKNASWEMIYLHGWSDKRPACKRAIIPASDITENPDQLIYFQRVPATNWTRNFLTGRFILGYGMIEVEENVPTPYAPIPAAMGGRMVNIKNSFSLPVDSTVSFKVRTNDYVKFKVDGRQILYLSPDWTPATAKKEVKLSVGTHQVEYDLWLQHEQIVPQITASVNGGPDISLETLGQAPTAAVGR